MPKTEVIDFGDNSDKVYHLIAYFSLSFSWLISFYKKKSIKLQIIISCIIYGIIIEVLQSELTEYRTGDYKDILANTLGIVLGLLIFNQIIKKIKLN
ncbi:VanZ family protein [Polaribacter sp. Asnod1-A03]|uniref:VanZ family protein n=1 Tax=Polaribacter sp. Asnod1-A03 TaxID=3160581 RepID=UPI00386506AA